MDTCKSVEAHEELRAHALNRRAVELGLFRSPGRSVWGVVMEGASASAVTTLVATDDGAASLFTSDGAAAGFARDAWPSGAGIRLVDTACDLLFEFTQAWAYPMPDPGEIRFYLLTYDGVMTARAREDELARGSEPLSDLYYAGHDVLSLMRVVSEDPDWAAYIGSGAETSEDAPADAVEEEVVQEAAAPEPAVDREALTQAATKDDVDAVVTLLAQGADMGPDSRGLTPLMAAAYKGAPQSLRLLLAAGAPVEVRDGHGFTALMFACNAGRAECVRMLLEAGADVEASDTEGSTPIMFAAQHGHGHIVQLLLERGADANATGEHGLSAIGFAARNGLTGTVSQLLGAAS